MASNLAVRKAICKRSSSMPCYSVFPMWDWRCTAAGTCHVMRNQTAAVITVQPTWLVNYSVLRAMPGPSSAIVALSE